MKWSPLALASLTTLFAASALAAGPTLVPNSNRYHEKNPSAATGRAGNATLSVRALLGKDSNTVVEVTTGQLDSAATAPGNLSKVQMKAFDANGDLRWNRNYNGLTGGGSATYTYDDLRRGQPIQTQANITGIDGKRTNVVTVQGNVKLRPDVSVGGLSAPSRATVGAPVNIAATITETNGDVGATLNCVLFVDGAEVDRAPGVWIDGGGTVSCAFTQVFNSAGTKTLEVRASDVVPGDYDLTNNSATQTIEIVSASAPFYFSAYAQDITYNNTGRSEGWSRYNDGTYASDSDWNYSWDYKGWYQQGGLWGWSPTSMTFPLTSVDLKQSTGGATANSWNFTNMAADWSWDDGAGNRNAAVWRWDPDTYSYFYLNSWNWTDGTNNYGGTWTNYYRYAGAAVYLSSGYYRYWYQYNGGSYSGYYTFNDWSGSWGQQWTFGPDYTFDFTVTDATGTVLDAHPTVTLQPYNSTWDYPFSCYDYSWSWGESHYCNEYHYQQTGVYGYASGSTGN